MSLSYSADSVVDANWVSGTIPDDLDAGLVATEEVSFSIDGMDYVINLSAENAKTFRRLLAPYVAKAIRINKPRERV